MQPRLNHKFKTLRQPRPHFERSPKTQECGEILQQRFYLGEWRLFGEGALKVNTVKELGVFDHVWKDPQATSQVYSHVGPNGEGATVMMTFFQPAVMRDQQFDEAITAMDAEMIKLKEILER
jgi:hypothetical protein